MSITEIEISAPDIKVITEVNGHDQAPAARPYWQDRPCPSWCVYPEWHTNSDFPGERYHWGPNHTMTLTLAEPEIFRGREVGPDGEPLERYVSRPELTVYLQQEHGEYEARVAVSYDGKPEVRLTLAEARKLAEALSESVRAAAGPVLTSGPAAHAVSRPAKA